MNRWAAAMMSLAALVPWSPGPAGAGECTQIGPSIFCGTEAAHTFVGRSAIFRTGRPGELSGGFLFRDKDDLPSVGQVLPNAANPMPLPPPQATAPGRYIDLQRGRDFGAFEFPLDNSLSLTITGTRTGRLGPSLKPLPR